MAFYNISNNLSLNEAEYVSSIEHLTSKILVPLRVVGLLTNFINIIIFINKKFEDRIFKYLLFHSITDFVYLATVSISVNFNYGYDSFKATVLGKILNVIIFKYFTFCLALFAIIIEINISFQRYLTVANKSYCKIIKEGTPYIITLILLFICLAAYSPFILREFNIISDSSIYKYYILIIAMIRGPISTLILTVICILTLINFKKKMNKKTLLTKINCQSSIRQVCNNRSEIASRNITKMVFFLVLSYYIGYLPFVTYYLLKNFYNLNNVLRVYLHLISNVFKDFSMSISIFIYFYFNKEYKKIYLNYLKKIFRN
jgi:hypothetical protein